MPIGTRVFPCPQRTASRRKFLHGAGTALGAAGLMSFLPRGVSAEAPLVWYTGSQIEAVNDWVNMRSEEHTSELPSLLRNSSAVFCLTHKNKHNTQQTP